MTSIDMSPRAVAARLSEVNALNAVCDSLAAAAHASAYQLPDQRTLGTYMCLLRDVLVALRTSSDPEVADLADAVHNLPDLLLRWPDMNETEQLGALAAFEARHPRWRGWFTGVLTRGARHGWQLRWGPAEAPAR